MARVKRVDFSRKGKWLKLLFFAFVVYFSIILVNQHFSMRNLAQRRDELEEDITQLEAVNQQLKSQVDLLENDPSYIEGVVREKLGLVKEGETVYILSQWNITE